MESKYTIIQVSGKQLIFKSDYWTDIDYVSEGKAGDYIFLKKILLFKKLSSLQIGRPFLQGQILCQICQQVKGPKIIVLKTKPKKHYTRVKGQRQNYTRLSIVIK